MKAKDKVNRMDPQVLMGYQRWMVKHFDELVQKYPHKVIAVYRNQLVAVGDSFKEVYAAARQQGIEESPFVLEVPAPEDLEAIL